MNGRSQLTKPIDVGQAVPDVFDRRSLTASVPQAFAAANLSRSQRNATHTYTTAEHVRHSLTYGKLIGLLVMLTIVAPVAAQRTEVLPKALLEVGVDEHLDRQVPLDLEFVDSNGAKVSLEKYFDGERPVLLTLNYSNCPMLCSLQLNGLFDGLEKMPWDLGDQFQMITVSIDPSETPERARMTKQKYLKLYARASSANGYHCLTGRDREIKELADAVGFRYRYTADDGQFIHAAVTMVLTPDGRVSKYLYGVDYDPQTVRFSLLEAGEGKIGTTVEQILLFCFHYDSAKGRYGPAAFRLMQMGGGLTVFLLGITILTLRFRRPRNPDRVVGA